MKKFLLFVFVLLSIFCNHEKTHILDVSSNWEYRIGFEDGFLLNDPNQNESNLWKQIQLPNNLTKTLGLKNYSGFITLRKKISDDFLKDDLSNASFAIDAGRILDVSVFYLNGNKFAEMGKINPYKSGAMRPFIRSIPSNFFQETENYIQIVLYTDGSFPLQFMDKLSLGRSDEIFTKRNNEEILSFFFLTTYLVYGLYHILLGIKRPKDIYNLYFGLFCIVMSSYWFVANTNTRDFLFKDQVYLHRKLEHVLLFFSAPLLVIFLKQFFIGANGRIPWIFLGLGYFFSVITLFSPLWVMRILMFIWQFILLAIVLPYMMFFIVKQFRIKHEDAPYFLLGSLLFGVSICLDILTSQNMLRLPFLTNYAFFSFILGIVFIMGNKFMKVTNGFESLSKELEQKVLDRTKELQNALEIVQKLKVQQDGDYFLTSLLTKPFTGNFINKEYISKVDYIIKQKKVFEFKKKQNEIGGDLCLVDEIILNSETYTLFVNADAMGKSIQGAGGVLVFGTVFKSIVERMKVSKHNYNSFPETWLENTYNEIQNVFASFDGSMLISGIIGLIQNRTGMLYFFNAEHPYLILYRDEKASFLETENSMKKIGVDPLFSKFQLQMFRLKKGDILFCGSDGKDDILIGHDEMGNRIINEDETLILKHIEESKGDLELIQTKINISGELIDDLSILKLEYLEEGNLIEDHPKFETLFKEENWVELERMAEQNLLSKRILEFLLDFFLKEKNFNRASWCIDKLIQDIPENTYYIYLGSFIKKKVKQFTLALSYGERVLIRQRNHVLNLINLADIYRIYGNTEKAITLVEEALELDSNQDQAKKLMENLR